MEYSVAVRDAQNDQMETTVGASPSLRVFGGASKPANTAAADAGTLLATAALPSDWLTASSAGVKSRNGTWTLTGQSGAGAGTAGTYWRINQGATCHLQGTFGAAVSISTNSATAANSNVLNFASTTGVVVGQNISGTGIPVNSRVLALTGTTVTMSMASTAGVSSGVSITFGADMVADNNSIANGQTVSVGTFSITRNDA